MKMMIDNLIHPVASIPYHLLQLFLLKRQLTICYLITFLTFHRDEERYYKQEFHHETTRILCTSAIVIERR